MTKSGIYVIENTRNGRFYVGSAKDIRRRFAVHKRDLRQGRHHNAFLQNDWAASGEGAFRFIPYEPCPTAVMLEREQQYLDLFYDGRVNCYNIASSVVCGMHGRRHTDETRRRQSEAARKRPPMNAESRAKISAGRRRAVANAARWNVVVQSPSGERVTITASAADFAQRHGLDRRTFTRVLKGERRSCKGWRLAGEG